MTDSKDRNWQTATSWLNLVSASDFCREKSYWSAADLIKRKSMKVAMEYCLIH